MLFLSATVRAVHRLLEQRRHGNPWHSTKLLTTQLLSWILKRVNEASGLYQMYGALGDVIVLKGYALLLSSSSNVLLLSQLRSFSHFPTHPSIPSF